MNIILLSGGSGKRLWPLSNEVRSKQFLRIIKKGNSGERESMLERVYAQLERAGLTDSVVITTSKNQCDSIRHQLGNKIPIVIEPTRMNTFPAIALSCAYLYFNKKCNLNETTIVLPVDSFVEDSFFNEVYHLDKAVTEKASDIVLIGAVPTFPSEKYGYIIPEENGNKVNRVSFFKEKPDKLSAEKYISQGALWNCGIFAFKLGYLMNHLRTRIAFNNYDDVISQYATLEKTSFDYAVVEKAASVSVIQYRGMWMDIGTWNTLTEVMGKPIVGDVRISDCINTNVINELDIPVVVMGAKNMVVIASPDGFLVADKEQSSYIKRHVDGIDQRPMYGEQEWGEYKVIDMAVGTNGIKSITKSKKIKAGFEVLNQKDNHCSKVFVVIRGKCVIIMNDCMHDAVVGDSFPIPEGADYGLRAITDTDIIEISVGYDGE